MKNVMRPRILLWTLSLVVCWGGVPERLAAQSAAELFDDSTLHEIRLFVKPEDWQTLKDRVREDIHFPADLVWRSVTIRNISIRSRGWGSRNPQKPGLKLDFDWYQDQRFLGLNNLILDNAWQDPTFLREPLAMILFRRLQIAAPREAFARLYINGEYGGLYVIVEDIDKTFLKNAFGESDGFLYEKTRSEGFYFDYLGDDLAAYVPALFEAKTHEENPEAAVIRDMIRGFNVSADRQFVEQAWRHFDVGRLLQYLAVESYVAEWDGFAGDFGNNNYSMYRFEGLQTFALIPWDKDAAFTFHALDILHNFDSNVLTRRLMQSGFRPAYFQALQRTAAAAGPRGGFLSTEMERLYALIRQAAIQDPLKPVDNDRFDAEIEVMRYFLAHRSDFVVDQVRSIGQSF